MNTIKRKIFVVKFFGFEKITHENKGIYMVHTSIILQNHENFVLYGSMNSRGSLRETKSVKLAGAP